VAFLTIENVTKRWGETVGLAGLSLSVEEGELVTILGPSGSGKSTALRVIAGLEQADGGRVLLAGSDLAGVEPSRRGVAMVFQSYALFPHLSVADNIGFGLSARGEAASERGRQVSEVAEWLGLEGLLERRPAQLSGGERQRVALARGLVRRPRLLLLDEPLSNLDAQLRLRTRAELKRLHAEAQITMVHVTHDQAEALSLGNRVAVLDHGELQQYDAPERVYRHPTNRFVAGFVGSPPMNMVSAHAVDHRLRAGVLEAELPAGARLERGQEVVLGFRPEDLLCSPADGVGPTWQARLELAEQTGHERIWHLDAGGERLLARPAPDTRADPGDLVRLALAPQGVRLFDPDTGRAL